MANDTPPDPGAGFRDLVTQWERDFNAFANQVMGTEGFSQAMNQAQKAQLNMQQMFTDAMSRQYQAMNLPTRADVLAIAESIVDLGRRLERIENALALQAPGAGAAPPAAKRRPRTRRPPQEYLESGVK